MLTAESPHAESPGMLKYPLQLHQRASLFAAQQLEQSESIYIPNSNRKLSSKVGILSDPIGSGKTLLALCIALLDSPKKKSAHYFTNEFVSIYKNPVKPTYDATLIIIPHGLVGMWKTQLEKFMPTIKYQEVRFKKNLQDFSIAKDTKIILVSSTILRAFANCFGKRLHWKRIIYEEGDTITIPSNPEFNSDFFWIITATPNNLFPYHKSTGFLRKMISSLYILLHNQLVSRIMIYNDKRIITQSVNLPNPIINNICCKMPSQLRTLKRLVSRQVMAALNADDMETAIQHLSCKADSKNNIIKAVRDDLEHQINNLKARIEYQERINSLKQRINKNKKKLESLEERLKNIIERLNSQNHCPICLDLLDNKSTAMLPCCHHWYCVSCLTQALSRKSSCPLCRTDSLLQDMVVNYVSSTVEDKNIPPSKQEELIKLLADGKKTLVFSNYSNALMNLEGFLTEANINFAHVKGSGHQITKTLKQYKQGNKLDILLLNSSYQCSGHNLENTERIILMHHLDNSTYQQVIGRAQRLGRTSPLEIVSLLYPNEDCSN